LRIDRYHEHVCGDDFRLVLCMSRLTASRRRARPHPALFRAYLRLTVKQKFCFDAIPELRRCVVKLVQVLGPGCAKCEKLKQNAEDAVQQSGVEAKVEKVSDINEITSFGVMMTPALVIDGEVKVVGKVPTVDEIKGLLA